MSDIVNFFHIGKKAENIIKDLSKSLYTYLGEDHISRIAKESGFEKRKNKEEKITGSNFLRVLLFQHESSEVVSLSDISVSFFNAYGKKLSKQGVDHRFNEASVCFFKALLVELIEQLLSVQLPKRLDTTGIRQVKITDGTSFQLPPAYCSTYPGSGGAASSAMIKIQYEYDLLSGKVTHLSLCPFLEHDSTHAKNRVEAIEAGDLILRDLSYQSTDMMESVDERAAFYLTKLPAKLTHIYTYDEQKDHYEKVVFSELLKKEVLPEELEVYLTPKKIKSRLILGRVPLSTYQQRVQRRKKEKKCKAPSQEEKARMHFNLYLTNLPQEKLSVATTYQIYRLRWQVELVFKTWKSYAGLAKVKNMKQTRFECMLYIRLIWLLIQGAMIACIQNIHARMESKLAISTLKLSKHLNKAEHKLDLLSALFKSRKTIITLLEKLLVMSPYYFELEEKKGSISSAKIIKNYVPNITF